MNNKTLKSKIVLAVSGCIFSSVLIMPNISHADALKRDAALKYRNIFMQAKGKHTQAIKLLVKKKSSYNHIVTHAEALANMADDMLDIFPANSKGAKSRALPIIWNADGSLAKEFIFQANILKVESKKMVVVAKEGDYKAIKSQLKDLANKGCRGCHSKYRGEDKK
jgi:cytochrome c556